MGEGEVREGDSVVEKQLAAQGKEKDHPLEHPDQSGRDYRTLQAVPRIGKSPKEERDENDCEGVVTGESGHHDSRVAEPDLLQPSRVEQVAEITDLARAANAGERT